MINKSIQRKRILFITTIIKYSASIILIVWSSNSVGNWRNLLIALTELMLIVLVSDSLMRKDRTVGRIINIILCLIFNAQLFFLRFSGTFLSLIMVNNIGSISALGDRLPLYIICAIGTVAVSLLPITVMLESIPVQRFLLIPISIELILTWGFGYGYSPICAYPNLLMQMFTQKSAIQSTRKMAESEDKTHLFYKPSVSDYVSKPDDLQEKPNIVLIFTEGLSQSIIDDPRNLMPNISYYQQNSLSFDNYYNHTAATYRGLTGQLYSGYQQDNYEKNHLISLQSLLHDKGYRTIFINVEPRNQEFTEYLSNMKFDELWSDAEYNHQSAGDVISDRDAYNVLFSMLEKSLHEEVPVFIVIYTIGTHVGLESPDEIWNDGSNAELSKFYNLDSQFGSFMRQFNSSPVSENTLLAFTTDHATYVDDLYRVSFPSSIRAHDFLDKIPLFFYYKGIIPQVIDAKGRNSLDLAPTLLDYLDVSGKNYFLGQSLFAPEKGSEIETVYTETLLTLYSSDLGIIQTVSESSCRAIAEKIQWYFVAKLQDVKLDSNAAKLETVDGG